MDGSSFAALLVHAGGCVTCNADLRSAILDHRFGLLLLTVAPLTLAGGSIAAWAAATLARWGRIGRSSTADAGALAWAAALIGAAFGAFLDGILLHQVLQVHDLISNSLPPDTLVNKGVNAFWSGIFQLSLLAMAVVGIICLWRRGHGPPAPGAASVFAGSLIFGWGAFQIFDAVVFHGLLRFHDLVEATATPWTWNVAWGVLGTVLAVVGAWAIRRGRRQAAAL